MPKKNPKLAIHLDLLKPQSNPEKFVVQLFHWILFSGRYILIVVEAIVLLAFIARFKLDGDLAAKKEAIEQQIVYIEALRSYEVLIRQTQFKLLTISEAKTSSIDYPTILKKISDQTPTGVKITSLNLGKNIGSTNVQINAQTTNNAEVTSFISGLRQDQTFRELTLTSIGLEQGLINFTIGGKL